MKILFCSFDFLQKNNRRIFIVLCILCVGIYFDAIKDKLADKRQNPDDCNDTLSCRKKLKGRGFVE